MAGKARPIRRGGRQAQLPAWRWPLSLAVVISAVVAICLFRLAQRHAVSWIWPVVLPLLMFGAATSTLLVVQRRVPGLTPLLVAIVLLLSAIGMLLRISLGKQGMSIWPEPLVGALGLLLLFAAAEFTLRFQPGWHAREILAVALLLVAVWEASERGRLAAVSAGTPAPTDWPLSLLTFMLLGLVAGALTRPQLWLKDWCVRRLAPRDIRMLWISLPVLAALALLAYTANLSTAVALFVGGLSMLASIPGVPAASASLDSPDAQPGDARQGHRPRRQHGAPRSGPSLRATRTGLVCLGGFFLGAYFIAMAGAALDIPDFRHMKVVAGPSTDPYAFWIHYSYLFGSSWQLRLSGMSRRVGAGQAILPVIARESGVAGLVGLLALFIGLLGTLFILSLRGRGSFGSAWMLGLAAFLGTQVLISTLRLLRVPSLYSTGPPLLAGGAAWYVATLMAIGVALGCVARQENNGKPPAQQRPELPDSLARTQNPPLISGTTMLNTGMAADALGNSRSDTTTEPGLPG
jgi:hypothetical protein